jgi:PAS domain S-box-containing protein
VYANEKCEEMMGYTREEFYSPDFDFLALIAPEDRDLVKASFGRHTKGEDVSPYDYVLVTKEGKRIDAILETKLIWYERERAILGTVTDISERKEAEKALQQANLVVENSPAVLFRWKAAEGWPVELVSENVIQFGYTPEDLLSGEIPYTSLVHPDDLERVAHEVQEYSASGVERFQQEYRIITKDGRVRWAADRTAIERDADGQITHYQGIVIDVTERKEAEEALHQRVTELATLNRIAQIVATVTDLPAALETAAETVAHLFDAYVTVITVLEAEQMKVLTQFGHEQMFPETPGQVFPLPNVSAVKQALDQGQAFVIPDAQTSPLPSALREHMRARNIHTVMVVPLRARGAVIGMMGVGTDQADRVFTPAEVALAETIAGAIAGAIKNVRLYEQAQVVAADAERQRLARELHDSVAQSLYSMTLLANGWGTMAEQGRLEDAADCFTRIGDVGQQALKEMRLLIYQLRPPILEEVGLVGALQQRLDSVEQRASVETRLLTEGDVDQIPHAVEEQLFHIALQALNNALWHAGATAVTVRIQTQESRGVLSVEDNGIGFDPAAPSAGMGLGTMRERAAVIGGEMSITSTPQQGTKVEITFAIQPDGEEQE